MFIAPDGVVGGMQILSIWYIGCQEAFHEGNDRVFLWIEKSIDTLTPITTIKFIYLLLYIYYNKQYRILVFFFKHKLFNKLQYNRSIIL